MEGCWPFGANRRIAPLDVLTIWASGTLLDQPVRGRFLGEPSGKVMLDGADMSSLDEDEKAKIRMEKIGFMFQMHYLLPEFTVFENISIPAWEFRITQARANDELLRKLGIYDRKDHLPSELSGGEQQRVALARALVNKPLLLLADEPTGNLDSETGKKVEDIIFSECRERKVTLVIVTHNIELAKRADRIINLRDGEIVI